MPFGPVNPIDAPYGQYVYDYTHTRKTLCLVSYGHIARGPGQLNGNEDRREVNQLSLREHGMHFLPRILIQLTRNPLGSVFGGIQCR
ncbi:hypothetical protein AVEN_168840-1 [Araneus ventricosus]|uniref:Uncharacterized protein n=1 Tax=Araneus ventricosus TaxID=182803 RepID=A0A4Y2JAR7_ARAVE|nr:hypothetical protein AVEN_41169-1 [Araneus ventricosus]GBM86363.1 hypothetical protein AVEN_168840-1 [Araneus ventricosus]